jgi:hypothetical protein
MLCRVEILKRPRTLICAHYKIADTPLAIAQFADQECKTHDGDGYRIRDLHTDEVRETWG